MVQAVDVAEGVLEGHAIGEEPDVLLELLQRRLGVGAEEAVVYAAGEAERVEGLLQRADVGAVEVGESQVERSVAKLVGGVDEGAPAGGVHLVAGGEPGAGAE